MITGRGLSVRQHQLVVWIALSSWFVGLALFLFVHSFVLAVGAGALGLGVSVLLARGWRVVVDQEGGAIAGRRATHGDLDRLVFLRNAGQLRGALRVLGRWQSKEAPPTPSDAAALGTAQWPDADQVQLEQEAWALIYSAAKDGSAGPTYYVTVEGTQATRISRRCAKPTTQRCYAVPTLLRVPANGRAYFELAPERAQRVAD